MSTNRTPIPPSAFDDDPFWGIPQDDEPYFVGGASLRDDRLADRNDER